MRGHRVCQLLTLCVGLCWLTTSRRARADDGIFPPAPVARPFINFDGRGFLINGQRTFIVSGGLDYARVPRALWRDRLLRLRRAGFNTVQTDVFWNLHEPREGQWDFSGDKDLEAFLKLVLDIGLYAVVRPGPYVGGAWDSGGLPVWLRFQPGVRVRQPNTEFEAAADRWFDQVMPIIAANQIHRGGAVIMVQLEQQHPKGAGCDLPNEYFKHLQSKALQLGLQVPYFFSGLHQGNDPAGDKPWDSQGRTSPWYSTDLRTAGPNQYRDINDGDLRRADRALWKVLAYGGNGYNVSPAHGGTNFEASNSDEVSASNDYGAAIGQAGDLRPIYYSCKRAAWFARTFAGILTDSTDASDEFKDAATDANVHATARRGPAGTIVFLDNDQYWSVDTQLKINGEQVPSIGPLSIGAGEIMPVVMNYQVAPGITLDLAATRILGISTQGDTTTLVVYGPPGSAGELRFGVPANRFIVSHGATVHAPGPGSQRRQLIYNLRFPDARPAQYSFTMGAHVVRILALSDVMADRTWFVEAGTENYILAGLDYAGPVTKTGEQLRVVAERQSPHTVVAETAAMRTLLNPANEPEALQSFIVSAADGLQPLVPVPDLPDAETAPARFFGPSLITWQMHRGDAEAAPQFDDHEWLASDEPMPLGADGEPGPFAWYRAHLRADKSGDYALRFSDIGDWASVFLNGQRVASSEMHRRWDRPVAYRLHVPLNEGDNTLAVLTAHYGRSQLAGHLGPIDQLDAKGIVGTVAVGSGLPPGTFALHWRWKADRRGEAGADQMADPNLDDTGADWKDAKPPGEDVFNNKKGFVWYRAALGPLPGPDRVLHFQAVDDNATVYLNGERLLRHTGWNLPFDVPLDEAWNEAGPNVVAVLVENNAGPGGIRGAVDLDSGALSGGESIRGWKMRGGPGVADAPGLAGFWQPFNAVKPPEGYGDASPAAPGPAFYRTQFTMPAPPTGLADELHLIYRISLAGMSRGCVWLNSHNLGRYPEKLSIKGLYLPECWLNAGLNTLIIYDEEGNPPGQVHFFVEEAASRSVVTLEARAGG